MIADQLIQADILAKIKSTSSITTGTNDIREFEWQGDDFTYPNLRLDVEDNTYEFDEQERCQLQKATFSIYVYSEQRTSKECSYIKGLVATALIGLGFTGTYARYIRLRLVDNVPAVRETSLIWRSQLRLETFVQNKG